MPAPRFRPFLKMSARGAGATGGTWVATEKIHGANFVVAATADGVWFGKRKAWLEPAEPFFGWQLVASELAGAAHAPDVRYAPFDVLVAANDDGDGELLAFSDVEELVTAAGLVTPPVVGRGRLADLDALPVRTPTRVPAALGLPALDDNIAEGLVLKQDVRAAPADRPIVKRKIAEMDEARFDESAAWQPGDVGAAALELWAARLVNSARIASARSKVGTDAGQIAERGRPRRHDRSGIRVSRGLARAG